MGIVGVIAAAIPIRLLKQRSALQKSAQTLLISLHRGELRSLSARPGRFATLRSSVFAFLVLGPTNSSPC